MVSMATGDKYDKINSTTEAALAKIMFKLICGVPGVEKGSFNPFQSPSVVGAAEMFVTPSEPRVTPCSSSGRLTLPGCRLRKSTQTFCSLLFSTISNLTRFAGAVSWIITELERGAGGIGKQSARVNPLTGGSRTVTRCCARDCQFKIISGCSGERQGVSKIAERASLSKSQHTSRSGMSCGTHGYLGKFATNQSSTPLPPWRV